MIGVPWVWKWTINSRPFEANSAPEVTDMNLKTIEKLQIIRSDVCSIRAVKFSPSQAARPAIFQVGKSVVLHNWKDREEKKNHFRAGLEPTT